MDRAPCCQIGNQKRRDFFEKTIESVTPVADCRQSQIFDLRILGAFGSQCAHRIGAFLLYLEDHAGSAGGRTGF